VRVLVLIPDLNGPGGVAYYYRTLLGRFRHSVDYQVVGKRYAGRDWPPPIRVLIDWIRFAARAWRYDVVHINPSLCAKCFFRDIPFVWTAGMMGRRLLVFFRGWDTAFEEEIGRRWIRLFRWGYGRADACVVLAAAFEEAIRRWGYGGPTYRETTLVDERMLGCSPPRSEPGVFRILFMSRVERDKGIYEATEAVRLMDDGHVELAVAGDGAERQPYEQYVREQSLRFVKMRGYLRGEEKSRAYQSAHVFLFPSTHGEGMPNAVLEAMAFGLPCIVCDAGGLRDFFVDGVMGFLLPYPDPVRLSACLRRMRDDADLRRRMSEGNAAYARERFLASAVVRRLEAIYEQMVRGGVSGVARSVHGRGQL